MLETKHLGVDPNYAQKSTERTIHKRGWQRSLRLTKKIVANNSVLGMAAMKRLMLPLSVLGEHIRYIPVNVTHL
jgi:hypothetical protein